ncbi:MAG TPA: hypothetical protein VMU61_04540 [Candidatus Aquilonibacter sp.]|nr:hypothetical protein [Candidatus Aquilonibacter sp.]
MGEKLNWKRLRILLPVFALLLAASAASADDNYYRGDEAGRIGYQNGYRDGVEHGRFDRTRGYRYNIHSQLYNDARDGYDRSLGPYGYFKKGYRAGYAHGYAEGYSAAPRYEDNRWRRDDGWR